MTRIGASSDGYVALRTAEGIDARGFIADRALDAAYRAVDAVDAGPAPDRCSRRIMSRDDDEIFARLADEGFNSAVEAIDDAAAAATNRRLPQSKKDLVREKLDEGFTAVHKAREIGGRDVETADSIVAALHLNIIGSTATDEFSDEVLQAIRRAFVNFAESLMGLYDTELREREH